MEKSSFATLWSKMPDGCYKLNDLLSSCIHSLHSLGIVSSSQICINSSLIMLTSTCSPALNNTAVSSSMSGVLLFSSLRITSSISSTTSLISSSHSSSSHAATRLPVFQNQPQDSAGTKNLFSVCLRPHPLGLVFLLLHFLLCLPVANIHYVRHQIIHKITLYMYLLLRPQAFIRASLFFFRTIFFACVPTFQ